MNKSQNDAIDNIKQSMINVSERSSIAIEITQVALESMMTITRAGRTTLNIEQVLKSNQCIVNAHTALMNAVSLGKSVENAQSCLQAMKQMNAIITSVTQGE